MNWVYPPLCLHCQEETKKILCEACTEHLHLADLKEGWIATALENQGPAASILREFRTGQRPELAKAMAGYMVLQLQRQNWPHPDLLVPVPQTPLRFFDKEYHHAALLAKEMGYILNLPVVNLLRRKWGGFSQARLPLEKRRKLPSKTFQWRKKSHDISGKNILLVDDWIVTGATLSRCKHRLKEGLPAQVFGLVFSSNFYFDSGSFFVV